MLSPLAHNSDLLKDAYEFINCLNKLKMRNSDMATFDVESLISNEPLGYTINLILDRIYKNKER